MRGIVTVLSFTAVSVTVGLMLCLIGGSLNTIIAGASLILGLGAGFWVWRDLGKIKLSRPSIGIFEKFMFFSWGLFCFRHFFWLYFQNGSGMWTLDRHNFGDLSQHITFINYIARGVNYWPNEPFFVDGKFHYPFGMDFLAAYFVNFGLSLAQILPITGLIFGITTAMALFWWGGGLGMAAFLFSGGTAGYKFLTSGILADYQADIAWKNLALTILVPQRGFLFALPAGIVLIWAWQKRFLENTPKFPFYIEGLLWGLMPLFQFHTFIFLSSLVAIWTLATKSYNHAMRLFAWAFIPATIETWYLTGGFHEASIIWFKRGWMIGDENIFKFFWVNFGAFVILFGWVLYIALKRKIKYELLVVIPSLCILLFSFFVMMAPWEWDNIKIILWAYLLPMPLVANYFAEYINSRWLSFVYLVLFLSGTVVTFYSLNPDGGGYELFRRDEMEEVCATLNEIPPDTRIATGQTYNHPVSLCGHGVVAGYEGYLWSHGINSKVVSQKLKDLMLGTPQWRLTAKDLGVRYIYWGTQEKKDFGTSLRPWETEAKLLSSNRWGNLFYLGDTP